jgi:type IV secretion system protein VirD4
MLVYAAGHAPILGTQSLYFRDPVFLARSKIVPPRSSAVRATPHSSTPATVEQADPALKAALWGERA